MSCCRPGNHETDNMNQIYGFEGEVKAKYTAQMYELFSEVFEWLPLAQCINGKVLVRQARPRRRYEVQRVRGLRCGWPLPSRCCSHLNPRSCTGACSVKTASPWTTSGRSSGVGSPQIQVIGEGWGQPLPPGARGLQPCPDGLCALGKRQQG